MSQVKDPCPVGHARAAKDAPVVRRAISRVQAAVTLDLTQALSELENTGGPVYVFGPQGKPVAALISVEHAHIIEDFEDRRDATLAVKAKAEFNASGEKAVPWEEVKAKAGL